jgi:hypothetical protein
MRFVLASPVKESNPVCPEMERLAAVVAVVAVVAALAVQAVHVPVR